MQRCLAWTLTVATALLLLVCGLSTFVGVWVHAGDVGYSITAGQARLWLFREPREGMGFTWPGFEFTYWLNLQLRPGVWPTFIIPLWAPAILTGFFAAWLWESRWRRQLGFQRWALTFLCVAGVTLWATSLWTWYSLTIGDTRVMLLDGGVGAGHKRDLHFVETSLMYEGYVTSSYLPTRTGLSGLLADTFGDRISKALARAAPFTRRLNSMLGLKGDGLPPRVSLLYLVLPLCVLTGWLWYRAGWPWRAGRCLSCGYDLRGSGDVCPECGTRRDPAASSAESAS